jgi:hypothetical protein
MTKHYSNHLKANPGQHHDYVWFDPKVVNKYLDEKGPWNVVVNQPGSTDRVNFWGWNSEGAAILLVPVYCSIGAGERAGQRGVFLTDLAAMPENEQEHWKKFERP